MATCIYVCYVCCTCQKPEVNTEPLGLELIDGYEPLFGCWELNPGLLQRISPAQRKVPLFLHLFMCVFLCRHGHDSGHVKRTLKGMGPIPNHVGAREQTHTPLSSTESPYWSLRRKKIIFWFPQNNKCCYVKQFKRVTVVLKKNIKKNILTKKRFIEISRIERKLHNVNVLKKI